jgi:hypothetical protein
MHSYAPLLISNCALLVGLPAVLFLWRKKRSSAASAPKGGAVMPGTDAGEDWLYVGKDEDSTRFYLDTQSLSYNPANPIKVTMWAKYRPLKGSTAFLNVEAFLQAAGKDAGFFDYIRQRLEIDYADNMVGDLELVFHASDGQVIDSLSFRAPERKKVVPGSLHELLHKTVEGMWRTDRFPGDPELRLKIQEKLKEINKEFEAFETAGE